MEIQITQEQVDAVIETIVRNELDNFSFYEWDCGERRKASLHDYVSSKTREAIDKYIKKKFDTLIDEEMAELARMEAMAAFLAKPVKITDGYRESEYDSWSSYLLKSIHEKSLLSWDVKKEIRKTIDRLVEQLWNDCQEQARTAALARFDSQIRQEFNVGEQQ